MYKSARKKELEKIISTVRKELNEIVDSENIAANSVLVGNYYKYRNSDGTKKWWAYRKIIGISDRGSLISFDFEVYPEGKIFISPREEHVYVYYYQKITRAEFDKAWKKLLFNVDLLEV